MSSSFSSEMQLSRQMQRAGARLPGSGAQLRPFTASAGARCSLPPRPAGICQASLRQEQQQHHHHLQQQDSTGEAALRCSGSMSVVVEQMASSPARSSHGAAREAPAAAVTAAALAAALGLALGPCAGEVQAAGLDAAAAHTVGDFLRPMLTLFTFLFIVRIPMTWYPELDINAFPWNAAYGPTEPVLSATRKVVPLVGGVDITPIIWVGLLSFFSEILLGPQGLLVLIERQGGL